jgi:hypothetical protein
MNQPSTSDHAGSARTPPATDGESEPDRLAKVLDLVTYAAATTVVFAAISAVLGVAAGMYPLPGVKYGLFIFGWLAVGYGALMLRPAAAWRDDDGLDLFNRAGGKPDTKFQRLVQQLPPARFRQIPDSDRFSTAFRIFFSGVFISLVSIVMEQAFGIGP